MAYLISTTEIYRVDTEVVFGGGKESERIETIPYGEKMLYTNGDKSNIALKNVMVTEDNKISIDSDNCKGCGLCVNACKFDAITIDYTDETIDKVVNRLDNLLEIRE